MCSKRGTRSCPIDNSIDAVMYFWNRGLVREGSEFATPSIHAQQMDIGIVSSQGRELLNVLSKSSHRERAGGKCIDLKNQFVYRGGRFFGTGFLGGDFIAS